MKKLTERSLTPTRMAILTTTLLSLFSVAHAAPNNYEQSLARGAVEDVTPQQKYLTAIREAGGAYKEWLRECNNLPTSDRRACTLDAKAAYDRDMANARLIRGR